MYKNTGAQVDYAGSLKIYWFIFSFLDVDVIISWPTKVGPEVSTIRKTT